MALWVRSGGLGVTGRLTELSPTPETAAAAVTPAGVGKQGKGMRGCLRAVCCSSVQREADSQQQLSPVGEVEMVEEEEHVGIMCDLCDGSGWLLCDFCKGQKTNVKFESSCFYRRCPKCKAVGLVLCPKCKVFKCVTFPNFSDVET